MAESLHQAMLEAAALRGGRLTVSEFMELALYHPKRGYYRTPRTGASGDFVTSPHVHPLFAHLLARATAELWEILGSPRSFQVVDAGSAHGLLLEGIERSLRRWNPECASAAHFVPLEAGDDPAQALRRGPAVLWGNEVLDAMPVHQVAWRPPGGSAGGWQERYLAPPSHPGGTWEPQWGELSSPDLRLACRRLRHSPEPREVGLAAAAWLRRCAMALSQGALIFLDYVRSPSRANQLRAYRSQALLEDVFAGPGSRDLTAPVDLSALRRETGGHGLQHLGTTSQSRFLRRLGWAAARRELLRAAPGRALRLAEERSLEELVDPNGLGGFRVFGWGRGLGELPAGFRSRASLAPWSPPPARTEHGSTTYEALLG